ncbi:FadR/GntR family transcriptional regulator (plasmid) [Curtobacterium sp. MCLR17_007]|uniref:FadR/GntR family transcriptional regulator n=1 Tax=Curtobacterium sp. MCLR17_007 TaxID=2175648 RepID=UPI000DA9A972|nr:FadR/GntR family transcriptional regulator [Curtobacterium sp. MCLR17_007]WIB62114.1 FadR/GntR family transcriptional regulator [Curtobacterium sp. MCLR17_007]
MASLTDDAIARIQQMIVTGELRPGQRLPPEKELSESLGLSRNSLREAVKALELIRVLDVRRGDGTYVTSLEPSVLLEAVSFVVDMHHDQSLIDLLEVRRILEPAAAVLASARAKPEDIAQLRTLMTDVDESTGIEELVAHDLHFHSTIARIGGNEYLSGLLDALSSKTVRVRVWRGLSQNGSTRRTLDEHAAIVDAIGRRDPQLVQSLVTAHVEGVERWVRQSLAEDPTLGGRFTEAS